MIMEPKCLPWISWAEWEEISKGLKSDAATTAQMSVIQRLQAWRCRGRLPVAVESTISLLEVAAAYEDPKRQAYTDYRQLQKLRSLYSIAIIRAINGLVEAEQSGYFAEPVNCVAGRLGIPESVVDVRHEATHDQLPSLSSLRMAAVQLLDWLHHTYWQIQSIDLTNLHQALARLFSAYCLAARQAYKSQPRALFLAGESQTHICPRARPGITLHVHIIVRILRDITAATTPSSLCAFVIPILLGIQNDGPTRIEPILFPDHCFGLQLNSSEVHTWRSHRDCCLPLLLYLQASYPGFIRELTEKMRNISNQQQETQYNRWLGTLCSRYWHSGFDYGRAEAQYTLRGTSSFHFNLRSKPSADWSPSETRHMEEAAKDNAQHTGGIRLHALGAYDVQGLRNWTRVNSWIGCRATIPPLGDIRPAIG